MTTFPAYMRDVLASLPSPPPPLSDEEKAKRRRLREAAEFVERAGSAAEIGGWSQFDPSAAWWPARRQFRRWPIPFDDIPWALLTGYDRPHPLALTDAQCDAILELVDNPEVPFEPERHGARLFTAPPDPRVC